MTSRSSWIRSCARARRRAYGYSLLELLVVLTIIALALTIAPAAFRSMQPALAARAAAGEIAALMRATSGDAQRRGQDAVVFIDVENRKAWSSVDGAVQQWPDSVTVIALVAGSEKRGEKIGGVRFFYAGGSTGGRIRVIGGNSEYDVNVDWLLGAVNVTRAEKE